MSALQYALDAPAQGQQFERDERTFLIALYSQFLTVSTSTTDSSSSGVGSKGAANRFGEHDAL